VKFTAIGPALPGERKAEADRVPPLLEHHQDLLIELVEASRRGTGAARTKFLLAITSTGDRLLHPGLPGGQLAASEDDVAALAENRLVRTTRPRRDTISITLTPLAVSRYDAVKAAARERVARVESDVRRLLQSDAFQRRYPAAYANWAAAESQLWRDSRPDLRLVARYCREALRAFAASLVERFRTPGVAVLPEDSVYRLRAVIEQHAPRLGPARVALAESVLTYWSSLSELVEQTEDRHDRTGATQDDVRSLVLHTLVVLLEVDRSLNG
jgi:hypothetical protein